MKMIYKNEHFYINTFHLCQLQLSGEELHSVSERDSRDGIGSGSDAASPLTARSLRLERVVQALAHSQEELRRYIFRFAGKKNFSSTSQLIFLNL